MSSKPVWREPDRAPVMSHHSRLLVQATSPKQTSGPEQFPFARDQRRTGARRKSTAIRPNTSESGYNPPHLCHSPRVPASIRMRSSRRSALAEWRSYAPRRHAERDVAIKVLAGNWSRDHERLRRFEQEAQATAALNHPNIVSIFHVRQYNGSPYIVTELLQDETCASGCVKARYSCTKCSTRRRTGAGWPPPSCGNRHRDLKPENISVHERRPDQDPRLRLAKLTRPRQRVLSRNCRLDRIPIPSRSRHGRLHVARAGARTGYRRPQRHLSVEVILYEMLTRKPAFRKATSAETMTRDPQRRSASGFAACAERPAGIAQNSEPLPGQESGATGTMAGGPSGSSLTPGLRSLPRLSRALNTAV